MWICQYLFRKNLSNYAINFLFAQKADHQSVGKAYDFRAAAAKSPGHTVMIGAVGLGDSDLSVLNGDYVVAAIFRGYGVGGAGEQIHGVQNLAFTDDLGLRSIPREDIRYSPEPQQSTKITAKMAIQYFVFIG